MICVCWRGGGWGGVWLVSELRPQPHVQYMATFAITAAHTLRSAKTLVLGTAISFGEMKTWSISFPKLLENSDPQECHLEVVVCPSHRGLLLVYMLRYTHGILFRTERKPAESTQRATGGRRFTRVLFLEFALCQKPHRAVWHPQRGDTRLSQIDTATKLQAGAVHSRQNSESTRRGSFLVENLSTAPLEDVLSILFFLQRQSAASTASLDTNLSGK